MSRTILRLAVPLLSTCLFTSGTFAADENDVSFSRDIRPILADRCFTCHGPDSEARQADLRLDVADGAEGAHASAITPGAAAASELWDRITSDDEDVRMPPPDANKPALTESELALFKTWIDRGAKYDGHWAFQTPRKPKTPSVANTTWSHQPIDGFVLRRLESEGSQPSEDADARTLIRRLTLDLTGLPPSRNEVHTFLDKVATTKEAASPVDAFNKLWSETIDELTSRPQYGEHMARFWLDAVRFADTNGMHKDFYRNNIAYRDWVIRSFNANLGYDDFLRYQLAGDLYDEPTNDQLVASGFHRLHLIIDAGTALPEESFTKNVLDRLTSFGTAFLGMTVHCAQCHDHKYDPISQKEFYSLYAFFNNIDAKPETERNNSQGLQPPFVSLGTPEQKEVLATYDTQLKELEQQINEVKSDLKTHQEKKKAAEESAKEIAQRGGEDGGGIQQANDEIAKAIDSLSVDLKKLEDKRKQQQQERKKFDETIEYAMVMKERGEARETRLLVRGQYDNPGDVVERGTPAFLPPLKQSGEVATRLDLANWLTDGNHPLTSRVAVNRIWQQFFGVGLVKTSEDLGAQGEVPSHPDLLEHLATSFVASGWNTKSLVKEMVMSRTYRQSSLATQNQFETDPENRMLARGSRFRLDAEVIRDQILATSGLLSKRMYGSSVKPPQPEGLWKAVTMTGQRFKADSGESIRRRSLYTFWKRAMPPPQMTIMNAPTRAACIARRERTNTPSQALLLLNESEYHKAARELAMQTLQQKPKDRIGYMWESVTCRLPDDKETALLKKLIRDLTKKYKSEPELADASCEGVDLGPITRDGEDATTAKARLAAWTMIGNTLYNLDITKTRE